MAQRPARQLPRNPFDRYVVNAVRIESGGASDERFFVWEIDLPNDDLGPRTIPPLVSETQARSRLAELGLPQSEIDARITWAKRRRSGDG